MAKQPNWESFFNPQQIERLKTVPADLSFTVVGIDPSINSTGVTVLKFDTKIKGFLSAQFFVITRDSSETREYVNRISYEKELHENRTNTELESTRLLNFQNIADTIVSIINKHSCNNLVGVGIEGLAYNANGKKTKSGSILDLAGLNTLIRDRVTIYLNKKGIHKNFVTSLPPMSNKARFVFGHADKVQMFHKFVDEVMRDGDYRIQALKESYIFDVVDSYAVARNELHEYFNYSFMPKVEPKPVRDEPFIVKKRFKRLNYNFRIIEMKEDGKRAVLATSGELPLKILKSRTLKSIYEEVEKYVTDLNKRYDNDIVKDYLTKKTKKSKIIWDVLS